MMYKLLLFLCVVALVSGVRVPRLNKRNKLLYSKLERQARIIGGSEIPITDAPYFVQLEWGKYYWGGATILNKDHVLVSALEVDGFQPHELSIRAGSSNLEMDGSVHNVTTIKYHEDYDGISLYSVAILTISPDLVFDETRQNISLASVEPADGANGTIVGLGADDYIDLLPVPNLLGTVIQIIGRDSCVGASKTQICGGDANHNACLFDEGVPLVVDGELAGVMDNSMACGQSSLPGVYTSVALVKDWIEQNI